MHKSIHTAPSDDRSAAVEADDDLSGLRYEDALSELEQLVQAMESAQQPLDRLLESYQRGARLLNACRERLASVEQQVKILDNEQLKSWEIES